MKNEAVEILDNNQLMAIATLRPDGWPQNTIVGYSNAGFALYFMIFRTSQKFANIQRDPRVAIAVGKEPATLNDAQAVYAAAEAVEVTEPSERDQAWRLLIARHPNLGDVELSELSDAALMRADCRNLSVVDFTKGLGHTDALIVAAQRVIPESR
jgi:nitroimidazol reductase NimA-like FMN-containing flavoprotein (pyridoxamine 5'-phosphate oxidase superfamily)